MRLELEIKTLENIKKIILAGSRHQPRAVSQVLRSLINRWEFAWQRSGKDIEVFNRDFNSELLALMLVIQHDWPELFTRIIQYPKHLAYLHALVKNSPSEDCTPIELDEINNLGVLVDDRTKKYTYDVRYYQEIVGLFNAFDETGKTLGKLSLKQVNSHIALLNSQINYYWQNEHVWDLLLSGDPVRLKRIKRDGVEATVFNTEFLGRVRLLLGRIKEIKDSQISKNKDELVMQVEKLLFAGGYIGEMSILKKLDDLMTDNTLSLSLRLRYMYALLHRAFDGTEREDQQNAAQMLVNLLGKHKVDAIIKGKIAEMLKYIPFKEGIRGLTSIFENISLQENKHFKETLFDSLKATIRPQNNDYSDWGEIVFKEMKLDYMSWEDVIFILGKFNDSKLDWDIHKHTQYLIKDIKSIGFDETLKRVDDFYKEIEKYQGYDASEHEKQENSSELARKMVSELVNIVHLADYETQGRILAHALEIQYNLQKGSQRDEWQSAWFENAHKLIEAEVRGVITIQAYSPEAVRFIRHIYEVSAQKGRDSWKDALGSRLISIAKGNIPDEAFIGNEIQKIAKESCIELKLNFET